MKRFLKIDLELGFTSVCDNEAEVIEGCGYDMDEITFEDLLEVIDGVYEIIEIEGEFTLKWLTEE